MNPRLACQEAPTLANYPFPVAAQSPPHQARSSAANLPMLNAAWENHIGNLLLLSEDGTVLHGTDSLCDRLKDLMAQQDGTTPIPQEIALICQMLKQCRGRFPSQNWAIEFDIVTKEAVSLHIRSRWLKLEAFDQPCILLMVEDRQQMVQDIVLDELQEWGLTSREREVWLLQQEGYTYSQIAEKLFISLNTVKKHMRSVHAKRRAQDDS